MACHLQTPSVGSCRLSSPAEVFCLQIVIYEFGERFHGSNANFPATRMRRMRRDDFSRRLMRESRLTADDLIYPVFVLEGSKRTEPWPRCPASSAEPRSLLRRPSGRCARRSGPGAVPGDRRGRSRRRAPKRHGTRTAWCRGWSALKKAFPELGVITDVALDPYTSHGQDGLIDADDPRGYVLNDETLEALAKQALVHAQAGADVVAPSDMMDGRIGRIRSELDAAGRSTRASWPIRPSTRRASTARSATRSARPATSARATSTPTRWIRRTATRRCARWRSTSPKAPTW
jgi:hypothetical protein